MQLEPFVGFDVGDNLGARLLPGWVRTCKPVLDHPLGEGLAADAGLVDQPQRCRDPIGGSPAWRRGRCNRPRSGERRRSRSIHRVSSPFALSVAIERRRRGRPPRACVRCRLRLSQLITVTGPPSRSAALGEATDEPADGRARTIRLGQIVNNIRMSFIEAAIGAKAIALLGDRQTDHMGLGRGQRRQHLAGLRRCGERAADHAHDTVLRRLRQRLDRVEDSPAGRALRGCRAAAETRRSRPSRRLRPRSHPR